MTNNTIKTAAQTYVPKTAKNVSELKSISVDLVLQLETGIASDGETYQYNYIEVDGEKYRIPDSVLGALKSIMEKKPTLKTFAVSRIGEGRLTKYTTIPLD